jgi:HlyD family secretion protein
MQIEADVDEADIGKIAEKQPVRFTVDAFPSRKFNGEVAQVRKASTVNNNVVTYKVVIRADNADKTLLPGMTANVDMVTGLKENVLRVPNTALRFKPAEGTTATTNGGNTMAQRRCKTANPPACGYGLALAMTNSVKFRHKTSTKPAPSSSAPTGKPHEPAKRHRNPANPQSL